ncbi:glycosyltransferase family 2 protein [Flavobacterium granuli]|uniref:Glycosyltransferase involved in cell wall biosynthesis n=1 Tax=Flavobacterium granuli TaxID=280093 RepID=A0ABU1S5U4_9FLAO|nr:glycosyltransferase family 2 protein [Flavobacterium granuli]MDR6846419.1 glycosyltransferase involved in cell wall biosynthesis [Flavobacterium granuli]
MLAIIIPYYKLTFFEAALQSLANQTDKRFKVYIGDDASPENPMDLLEKYNGKFDFVYHRFDTNFGGTSLTKQWERCIALSGNEEWIMILGDDDVLNENVIRDFYSNKDEIDDLNIDVVRFSTMTIDENDNKISKTFIHPKIENAVDSLMRKLKNLTRNSLSEYVFRKVKFCYYSFKDFPSGLFSDDILILEHTSFKNIFTINSSVVEIRKSKFNLSGSGLKINKRFKAILQFYQTLLTVLNEKFNKEQIAYIEYKLEREVFNHRKISIIVFLIKYYFISFKFLKLIRLLIKIIIKIPKLIYLKLTKHRE